MESSGWLETGTSESLGLEILFVLGGFMSLSE